jgi:ectoine hydroxylase-related dioxygenase (phytanoyl-CoA dioxygenase family)
MEQLDKDNLDKKGFCIIKNFFKEEKIERLEYLITTAFLNQAYKINDYRGLANTLTNDNKLSNFEKFTTIYEAMEGNDKEALYQVQKFLPESQSIREIFNNMAMIEFSEALQLDSPDTLLVNGPAVFVNRPNTERLMYKWHSEAHYYPKRRKFLNIWFPLFTNKSKENGTMSFKIGSHTRDFPFSEYSGYNKDSQDRANYFKQLDIPDNLHADYQEHYCQANRKDLVMFDRKLIHRSNNNASSKYSVAIVARIWEPSKDLTLSGEISALPYANDISRSGIIVPL